MKALAKFNTTDASPEKMLLDPLVSLQVAIDHHTKADTPLGSASSRSSIASVCFLPTLRGSFHSNTGDDDADSRTSFSSSSSSDDEGVQFRCRGMLMAESQSASDITRSARQAAAATHLLSGRYIASCHANGECNLWDLGQGQLARTESNHLVKNRGPGWMLRRVEEKTRDEGGSHFLYQTRDNRGTVSIHAWDHAGQFEEAATISSFSTYSQTFCAATPCTGSSNLVALPSANESKVTVRDWRVDSSSNPIAVFDAASASAEEDSDVFDSTNPRKHGMLTSLAFSQSGNTQMQSTMNHCNSSHPIIACGMESGTVFFHDLRMLGKHTETSFKLSNDPVLALDLAPSHPNRSMVTSSPETSLTCGVIAVAGMAGENVAQQEMAAKDQGTVAILKATFPASLADHTNSSRLRLRSRLTTCQTNGEGKPGVSLCRFQPGDGRLFAVAGWDHRVRIFDRAAPAHAKNKKTKADPLAILRGHTDSVRTMDWAPDSATTGLCATAAADGQIKIWRCFSRSTE